MILGSKGLTENVAFLASRHHRPHLLTRAGRPIFRRRRSARRVDGSLGAVVNTTGHRDVLMTEQKHCFLDGLALGSCSSAQVVIRESLVPSLRPPSLIALPDSSEAVRGVAVAVPAPDDIRPV